MKKVLFASTALALSAGVAAAEVKFSGDARLGLQYNSANAVTTVLEKRFTLNIERSTTTDGGVTLGARVRIRSDELTAAGGGTAVNNARVFGSYAGLTVAAGNIIGAIESVPNLYGPTTPLTMTGNGFHSMITNVDRGGAGPNQFGWDSYGSRGNSTASGDGIELLYNNGPFAFHVSYSADSLRGVAGGGNVRTAAYAAYTFSGWTVAVAVQDSNVAAAGAEDLLLGTISGAIGNFNVGLGYAQVGEGANRVNKVALNGSATFNGLTVQAHVANQSTSGGVVTNPTTFGIGAIYGLGGGATVSGGIQTTERGATRGDIGVAFRF